MLGIFESRHRLWVANSATRGAMDKWRWWAHSVRQKVLKYPGPILQSSDCRWERRNNKPSAEVFNLRNQRCFGLIAFRSFRLKIWLTHILQRTLLHLWLFYLALLQPKQHSWEPNLAPGTCSFYTGPPGGLLVRLFKESWRGLFCGSVKVVIDPTWISLISFNAIRLWSSKITAWCCSIEKVQLPIQFSLIT
jgi:hypothetical protein